jgi:hypothetical protein
VLESPLELWIENSTISRIATDVPGLEHDFNKYLDANPSNRRIEELGIGTNEGVKDLYARNAGFEERHCGLHRPRRRRQGQSSPGPDLFRRGVGAG